MDSAHHSIEKKVRAALDLIVSNAGRLKARIENMQGIAINARLDSSEAYTTLEFAAETLALQRVIRELDSFVDSVSGLLAELASVLDGAQPPSLQ